MNFVLCAGALAALLLVCLLRVAADRPGGDKNYTPEEGVDHD